MRALLIGGGVPGLELTRRLTGQGHAVRVVTREAGNAASIEAAGGECCVADPDRIGSLRYALDNVTVLLWLLGPVQDGELHGTRLQMMMERTIDTTVRGVIYEGTQQGAELVARMARYNEIPYAIVGAAREDQEAWSGAVLTAIDDVLAVDRHQLG